MALTRKLLFSAQQALFEGVNGGAPQHLHQSTPNAAVVPEEPKQSARGVAGSATSGQAKKQSSTKGSV